MKDIRINVLILVVVAALAWSSSITSEYVGYDDIKLIVRNDKVAQGIAYTFNFYFNIVSDSHNVAWTNYPTVIFRPLEWLGSSIGIKTWGPRAEMFHFCVNYTLHILNTILLFFILRKVLRPFNKDDEEEESSDDKPWWHMLTDFHSKAYKLAFVICLLWCVHPLHNEAINMLTSGVGFLMAMFLMFTTITIHLYTKNLDLMEAPIQDIVASVSLIILGSVTLFFSHLGSEMTIIGAGIVAVVLFLTRDKEVDHISFIILKILFAITPSVAYLAHRYNIVSEYSAFASKSEGEFWERLFVLSPQVFFHYIKLAFFPAHLSMDEHHAVVLQNAGTPYHLLCFAVAFGMVAVMLWGLWGFFVDRKNIFRCGLGLSILLTGIGIGVALNIIPLYVLARDRYTYLFLLGLIATIVILVDKFLQANPKKYTPIVILLIALATSALGVRAWVKSIDWNNGENFWMHTITNLKDDASQQVWRYRILEYWKDPGTKTFKINEELRAKQQKLFDEFPNKYSRPDVFRKVMAEAKDPANYLKEKYGYTYNKSVASALFFNAVDAMSKKDYQRGMQIYTLAHRYYPEHFQTDLQLFIQLYNQQRTASDQLLKIMSVESKRNSFLAKGIMDAMFMIKHHRTLEFARKFRNEHPNTQVFDVYLFHAARSQNLHDEAFRCAMRLLPKYNEENFTKTLNSYINAYVAKFGQAKANRQRKLAFQEK